MVSARTDSTPVVEGIVAGIVAWLVGYATTYALVAPDIRESPLHRFIEAFNGEPATYEMVGWVFFNAHFVDTVFRDLPLIGSHTTSFIGGEDGFTVFLYAVPVGLLLVAGVALARYCRANTPVQGALAGATALPGYLLLSVAAAVLFEVTLSGASGAPDLLPAIFLAGIVLPALFAAIGGVIGGMYENRA